MRNIVIRFGVEWDSRDAIKSFFNRFFVYAHTHINTRKRIPDWTERVRKHGGEKAIALKYLFSCHLRAINRRIRMRFFANSKSLDGVVVIYKVICDVRQAITGRSHLGTGIKSVYKNDLNFHGNGLEPDPCLSDTSGGTTKVQVTNRNGKEATYPRRGPFDPSKKNETTYCDLLWYCPLPAPADRWHFQTRSNRSNTSTMVRRNRS